MEKYWNDTVRISTSEHSDEIFIRVFGDGQVMNFSVPFAGSLPEIFRALTLEIGGRLTKEQRKAVVDGLASFIESWSKERRRKA